MVAHYIYYLSRGNSIVYIGSSVNPTARWRTAQRKWGYDIHISAIVAVENFECRRELELWLLRKYLPMYNKRISSGPSRLGMVNSVAHRKALSARLPDSDPISAGKRRWENRSRRPEDNPFYGKSHSPETREKIRKASMEQFSDPTKKERHRIATIAGIAKRIAAGLPFGRQCKKL